MTYLGGYVTRDWVHGGGYVTLLPRVRLLVMGSYAPFKKPTLERIRDTLQSMEGLGNARLVADFDSPKAITGEEEAAYNLRKSEYWIEHADVLLFVFLGSDDTGVTIELKTTLQIPGGASRSIVSYDRNQHVSSLLRATIGNYSRQVFEVPFETVESLCEQVRGCVLQMCDAIHLGIKYRPNGEWEY